jgi:hypothetical protein
VKTLLDSNFRYTPSDMTDIRKTFARARRELRRVVRESSDRTTQDKVSSANNVTPMRAAAPLRKVS